MTRRIDYGGMMHRAMQGLIADVLTDVSANGLPGAHHFYITFDSRADGVEMADWLHERYPEEMTIVLQHWFDDLEVRPDGFSVTLNFGNAPERVEVPFDSVKTFVDPSVEFGLRFETQEEGDEDSEGGPDSASTDAAQGDDDHEVPDAPTEIDAEETRGSAEVVSLDKWRK